ncbi:OmpA family protein [Flavobacterium swingsii]|uniref:OmpA family protein n=1 Tax=Flavobacterium swingsii TaxID=498292 RepID=A0A1I0YB78_9FLAO|nr:OmpA family protein [Flavobacterium swingsii]SFB09443.1 OmpA family protein [Flavobacterium swingsii]
MKKIQHFFFLFIFLSFSEAIMAQEEIIHSVYFDFDKFKLDEKQANETVNFIKKIDSTRIESVQIFGYCDDRGKESYNFKLSNNRASIIQKKLVASGIKNKIIVTIEGKGRVMIDDDILENLPEVRSKNRRVDVVINMKPLPKIQMPGMFDMVQKKHIVGDRIFLGDVLFQKGSSKLNVNAKNDLEKMAKALLKYKNLQFEIQGHVCCTPPYQKEAIDRDTRKRELSSNRAKVVYNFFVVKKIDKNRMIYKGYGNAQPLGKEPQYDRRVELVITKI